MLSADRYIAVCHPISAPKFRTPVIARCVSLSAWAVSALLMMPVFMYAATLSKPDGTTTCNIFWPSEDQHHHVNGTALDEGYVPPVIAFFKTLSSSSKIFLILGSCYIEKQNLGTSNRLVVIIIVSY